MLLCSGSLETLDTEPKKKGLNIREELLKFYDKYYSANLMKLVIYGKGIQKQLKFTLL